MALEHNNDTKRTSKCQVARPSSDWSAADRASGVLKRRRPFWLVGGRGSDSDVMGCSSFFFFFFKKIKWKQRDTLRRLFTHSEFLPLASMFFNLQICKWAAYSANEFTEKLIWKFKKIGNGLCRSVNRFTPSGHIRRCRIFDLIQKIHAQECDAFCGEEMKNSSEIIQRHPSVAVSFKWIRKFNSF